jgi:hypothetical protein
MKIQIGQRPFDEDVLIDQIGRMNVLAISGGRVGVVKNNEGETIEVELPCGAGYRVSIILAWDDTYTVTRQFVRKGTVFQKGTIEGVYCDQVGEIAYKASCFRNVEFGKVSA